MIFHQILFLLVLLFTVHSDEESSFHLQQTHEEISKFSRLAEMYHLESEVSNGKMTPIGLAERVLDVKIDEKVLEKYKEVDVSEGIKEHNELMDLIEKINGITVDEKLEKGLENGLNTLEKLVNSEFSSVEITLKTVKEEFKKLQDYAKTFYCDENEKLIVGTYDIKTNVKFVVPYYEDYLKNYQYKDIGDMYLRMLLSPLREIYDEMRKLEPLYNQVLEEFSYATTVTLKPLLKNLNGYGQDFSSFKGMNEQIDKMKLNLGIMESFRDFNQVETLHENFFHDAKKMIDNRYLHIDKNSPLLDALLREISNFSSKMQAKKRNVDALTKQATDFGEKLKTRQSTIPQGTLSKNLESIQSCLKPYEYNITAPSQDYKVSNEFWMNKINEYIKAINDLRRSFRVYWSFIKPLKEKVEAVQRLGDDESKGREMKKLRSEFEKFQKSTSFDRKPISGSCSLIYRYIRENLELESIAERIESVPRRADPIGKVVLCYEKMISKNSEVKNEILNLIPVLRKQVNLELQELESSAEVIEAFKSAYSMIQELKNQKIEAKEEGFPLDEEGVRKITEGVRIHEEILNIQKTWNILKRVNVVENLNQSMENFPISLKDPLPSLDLTEYHGELKMEILKFLEDVENFQKNSEEYSEKLTKMNGRIEEIKKWMNSDGNEENSWKDCFENSCDVTKLPEVTPDAPVVEFTEN